MLSIISMLSTNFNTGTHISFIRRHESLGVIQILFYYETSIYVNLTYEKNIFSTQSKVQGFFQDIFNYLKK